MKYEQIVTEKRIKITSLSVLLVCMSIAWYLDSSFWYNISILIVSISFILYGVDDYIVQKNTRKGIIVILLSVVFTLYNLARMFFL